MSRLEDENDPIAKWFLAKSREAKLVDWAQIILGSLVFAVGAWAAVIYSGQLAEMRSSNALTKKAFDGSSASLTQTLAKMQSQTDAMLGFVAEAKKQALEMQKLAGETKQLASEAKVQANASVQVSKSTEGELSAIRFGQRPWLGIEGEEGKLLDKEEIGGRIRLRFSFLIHNYGNSPALNVNIESATDNPGGSNGEPPPAEDKALSDCKSAEVGFTRNLTVTVPRRQVWPNDSRTFEIDIVNANRTYLYVPGCIAYKDASGEVFHTKFLYNVYIDTHRPELKVRGVTLYSVEPLE